MAGRGTPVPHQGGSRAAITVVERPDGGGIEVVVSSGGGESRIITLPDGRWTRTDDDGRGTTTDTSRSPDGRTVACAHFADGSWSYATDDGAGTTVERHGNADGTEFHQVLRCPDGSWTSYEESHGVVVASTGDDDRLPPVRDRWRPLSEMP
jgi:hypothetical protein